MDSGADRAEPLWGSPLAGSPQVAATAPPKNTWQWMERLFGCTPLPDLGEIIVSRRWQQYDFQVGDRGMCDGFLYVCISRNDKGETVWNVEE